MENALQIFENPEFGKVRVVMQDDEPWFVATDVCRVLGLTNPTVALERLDEDERSKFNLGRQGEANIVNESGLYALVLTSRKPFAKDFRKWLTSEVAVSIRKHGAYMTPETLVKALSTPEALIQILTTLKDEQEKNALLQAENKALEAKNVELEEKHAVDHPKAEFFDAVMESEDGILTTVIAKEYGMSAVTFNKLLNSEQIQYLRGGTWVLFGKYMNRGYTISKTIIANGITRIQNYWTHRGRKFLYDYLKGRGIVPVRERPQPIELFA